MRFARFLVFEQFFESGTFEAPKIEQMRPINQVGNVANGDVAALNIRGTAEAVDKR